MAHWEHRSEPKWTTFRFNQPYAKGLRRLKDEVLAKTDFDPATLWQWGTMQAMALIEVLKGCEAHFGEEGQRVAPTCHFTIWKASEDEKAGWEKYTALLEAKALVRAKREPREPG